MSQLVLSLFPGIGLLDHAFELEDVIVVRGPDPIWGGDIRSFHPPSGKFDGVIGGPPCQSFSSLAHLVRANGYEPRFGNLIPDFERCVSEAKPDWFVMENVPQAPEPAIADYGIKSFLLDNSVLAGEGGFGLEQRRIRRFTFGRRGRAAPNLLRWIDLAVFFLPDATSKETSNRRHKAVSSSNGGRGAGENGRENPLASNNGKGRYKLADAIRLQGLPEGFLRDAPFTAEGKLKAVANGVPIPMGRAIAKAVREALVADREQILGEKP